VRYHLNIRTDGQLAVDHEGADYVSLNAAKAEALLGAREIVAERLKWGKPYADGDGIELTDADGLVVHTVLFSALLT
jgi:hypothetical protein